MNRYPKAFLPIMVAALAVTVMAVPASADSSKKAKKPTAQSSAAAAEAMGDVPEVVSSPAAGQHDQKPGPAWRTIGGTVKHIKGDVYTVEDYEGNHVQLYVGQDTKKIRGNKKVGDTVRAEITRGGFANSIQ